MSIEAVEAALTDCKAKMAKCDDCRVALEAAKAALDAAALEWTQAKAVLVKAATDL